MQREDLVFLAAHDDDPFARYEALQELVVAASRRGGRRRSWPSAAREAEREARSSARSGDPRRSCARRPDARRIDDAARPRPIWPSRSAVADPGAIHAEREGLKAWLGAALQDELLALHDRASAVPYAAMRQARGARKVKTQALVYLAAGAPGTRPRRAAAQYRRGGQHDRPAGRADGALRARSPEREDRAGRLLRALRGQCAGDRQVVHAAGAARSTPRCSSMSRALAEHPDFTLKNPNRVRSLYMALRGQSQGASTRPSGEGYRMIADLILALDPINPQTAARFVPALGRWRRIEPGRAALMRASWSGSRPRRTCRAIPSSR